MSDFPYSHVAAKLKDFLDKIPSTGTPEKVTYNELAARGFKSTNDRSILNVLKHLGLVDADGVPTSSWTQYRDRSNNRTLLASLIRSAYADLYAMYSDAQERSDEEIRNFIASKTKVGEDSVQRMVATFKTLCGMADFSDSNALTAQREAQTGGEQSFRHEDQTHQGSRQLRPTAMPSVSAGSQVQVHFELHLHDTPDARTIDKIFESMARHLLGRGTEYKADEEAQD